MNTYFEHFDTTGKSSLSIPNASIKRIGFHLKDGDFIDPKILNSFSTAPSVTLTQGNDSKEFIIGKTGILEFDDLNVTEVTWKHGYNFLIEMLVKEG